MNLEEALLFAESYSAGSADFAQAINVLAGEVKRLQVVCFEAYQLAGAADAPVEHLDNFLAASEGLPLPHSTFPVYIR